MSTRLSLRPNSTIPRRMNFLAVKLSPGPRIPISTGRANGSWPTRMPRATAAVSSGIEGTIEWRPQANNAAAAATATPGIQVEICFDPVLMLIATIICPLEVAAADTLRLLENSEPCLRWAVLAPRYARGCACSKEERRRSTETCV